jgi:flagellar hook-associated protein 3 FlgL
MLNSQLLRNLNQNMSRSSIYQNQLSTGRRINKPSDDPIGITFSMRYRSELSANDQYKRNVDDAQSSLDYMDMVLGQAGDILQRVRELTVQASTGTNSHTALDAIRIEAGQLYDQMVIVGNSQFKGKYVFNGQATEKKPYSAVTLTDPDTTKVKAYSEDTDLGEIKYQLGAGLEVPVNITGASAFGTTADPDSNTFQVLSDLFTALKNYDQPGIDAMINRIDKSMDKLLTARSEVGARSNRVEMITNRILDINNNLQSLQAKTEDANIPEVITNLKTSDAVYQSSLSVGAKLITPSLVDFLK